MRTEATPGAMKTNKNYALGLLCECGAHRSDSSRCARLFL
jgi:hypothetical protein